MSKKRGLSPSASSRSSATPAPSSTFPSQSGNPELPEAASSPAQDALSVPGPSRASASSTPAPPAPKVERTVAKGGTIVPGSADDVGCGDECYLWTDLPMNKQGYRYVPCAPSPNTSPSPYFPFYRTLPGPPPCPPVHISWLDRSSFIRISPNALCATTDRGFRSARANVGVREGSWYYEVKILRGDGAPGGGGTTGGDVGNAHVRLGWGRREANFDSPIGMDGYSYGIRDVSGEKLHLSRPKPYAKAFGTGDIIGCLITLPNRSENERAKIKRKRVPIRYKGQLYFEMDEYGVQKEMEALVDREGKGAAAAAEAAKAALEATKEINEDKAGGKGKKGAVMKNAKKGKSGPVEPSGPVARNLPILEGSSVEFFVNGESQGIAFEDLYDFLPLPPLIQPSQPGSKKSSTQHEVKDALQDDGTLGYYPMISCFGRGKVECNFGPDFAAPPSNLAARPMVERWEEFRMEEAALDERDEIADTIRLKKEMADAEQRRIAAEAQIAARAAKGPNELKKKAAAGNVKKKRKGTDTPTQEGTPVPDGVKSEVDGSVNGSSKLAMEVDTPKSAGTSRAGTEEPVVKEEGGDDVIMSSH